MSENDQISLNIKNTVNTNTYNLTISKKITIKDLKNEIEKLTNIPTGAQKIVHKGKILKDTETIESYNIENNDSIVVIRNRNYNPNGARNTNLLGAFPQVNPGILNLLNNPNFMNIPELQHLMIRNNQLRDININNPNRLGINRNNQFMQNLIGRIPNNIRVDENLVGKSFPEIGNKFSEYMQNRNNNTNNNNNNTNNNNNMNIENNNNNIQLNPQNLFNLMRPTRQLNRQPPTNINLRIPLQFPSNLQQNNNNTQNENVNYREIYKEQLAQLKDMGFTDEAKNIEILKNCQGNINFAIEKLFSGGV